MDVNQAIIDQTTEALENAQAELDKIESEYQRLSALVSVYKQTLQKLNDVQEGNYDTAASKPVEAATPSVRRGSSELKNAAYEYFSQHPLMVQSPKGLCQWLTTSKGWPGDNLRPRVSNLLRKVVKEENWLVRAGHGKYQFKNN